MVTAERLPAVTPPPIRRAAEALEPYLEDASGEPPGHAAGLVRAASEAEAAAFLRDSRQVGSKILPQAARSSLTGGAIPHGEVVVCVELLQQIGRIERRSGGARVACGSGVRLSDLQSWLAPQGLYFPPVPTYQQAMLGGTVSTNAGGPASFKYGVTRQWVHGLRVLLFNGDLLCLERGQALAGRGDSFRIRLADGDELSVPVPDHRLPDLNKISAGYYAADPLDLVDLFIGSEGTLGLITGVTLELAPLPPALVTGLVHCADDGAAFELGAALRNAAAAARERGDCVGPDVRAIEWLDARCLELLRRHGDARSRRVNLPGDARAALLFEMELHQATDDERAQELLAALLEGRGSVPDHGLTRLFRILRDHDALDRLEFAFPEDQRRQRALGELREAVPHRAGELLARRRLSDPGVRKVGGDLIVPFEHLREALELYADGFARRGLEFAVWGHFADGNLHPNALPRNAEEVALGIAAQLEFADEVIRRGGCPLSEHGVGRSPLKQEMLRRFLGNAAVARMRRIKKAIDPDSRFAPGVLFPA